MPLYDYTCRTCGELFEFLVLHGSTPTCPRCQGRDLERHVSGFAVSSEATRQLSLNRAREANKKTQRDKAIADQEAIRHMHDDDH
jgi:putative FmdB family regulatory protein